MVASLALHENDRSRALALGNSVGLRLRLPRLDPYARGIPYSFAKTPCSVTQGIWLKSPCIIGPVAFLCAMHPAVSKNTCEDTAPGGSRISTSNYADRGAYDRVSLIRCCAHRRTAMARTASALYSRASG